MFKTETQNLRSRTAILALGATEEGTFARHLIADNGRKRDMVYFAIFDDMWPEVRRRLRSRLGRFAPGNAGGATTRPWDAQAGPQ